ncbi:hypothetical protein MTR67_032603 [Solanum verrucosum]|uniref:Uncharacterized protein n=1 Tax=Solanum verrucosum TaxID=315347 RepID=A0AAF0U4J0_SOLVR|nr:hypothetical protein MTR67_032603 [Solanum verrucosum]
MRGPGKEREEKSKFLLRIELLLTLGQVKQGTAHFYVLHKITSLNNFRPQPNKKCLVHLTEDIHRTTETIGTGGVRTEELGDVLEYIEVSEMGFSKSARIGNTCTSKTR